MKDDFASEIQNRNRLRKRATGDVAQIQAHLETVVLALDTGRDAVFDVGHAMEQASLGAARCAILVSRLQDFLRDWEDDNGPHLAAEETDHRH